jgi:prepilin-type N-terminal cleavage/methylation domain-containing protein
MNRQRGMTMIELMVSIAIVMLIIGAATTAYVKLLRTYKTQGRLAESYMTDLTGLELLRYDIEMAGFGLPANVNGFSYNEAAAAPGNTASLPYNPALLNDSNNAPHAFAHIDNHPFPGANGNNYAASDVLSIKSTAANIISNPGSKKWTMVNSTPSLIQWGDPSMDFAAGESFIILDNNGYLQTTNGGPYYSFAGSYYSPGGWNSMPCPPSSQHLYYLYGLDENGGAPHVMPFNRVDYYLAKNNNAPSSCAPYTLTLYRATINQSDGSLNATPLIDCVRDFQVAFGVDTDPTGNNNPPGVLLWQSTLLQNVLFQNGVPNMANGTAMTAANIQQYVREVRVFVLYSEGLPDTSSSPDFRFSGTLNLGDQQIASNLDPADYTPTGTNFQQLSANALAGSGGATPPQLNPPGYTPTGLGLQYRWKIIEIDVKPNNLLNLPGGTLRLDFTAK